MIAKNKTTTRLNFLKYVEDDGGREAAGWTVLNVGDCVTRAIAIATNSFYNDVYYSLWETNLYYAFNNKDKIAMIIRREGATPRDGVNIKVIVRFLKDRLNVDLKNVANGVAITDKRFAVGTWLFVSVDHMFCMRDGTIRDTWNSAYQTPNSKRLVKIKWFAKIIMKRKIKHGCVAKAHLRGNDWRKMRNER